MSVGCTTNRSSCTVIGRKRLCTITRAGAADCNSCVLFGNLLGEQGIGIDRIALPPRTIRVETCNREMEVRRILGCVSGAADISQQLPAANRLMLGDPRRVPVEVGVVIRK